jgi:chromosome segregation ATPase
MRMMHYWSCQVTEVDFVDLDSPSEEIVTSEFIRWREEWGSSFLPMPPSRLAVMTPSARTSMRDSATSDYISRILDLEQELEEVQDELDAERTARRESEPHYMVQCLQRQVARHELERERTQLDMLTLQGRVSDLEGTVDFVQDLLQSSEAARDALESTLADTRTRLEEKQIAWTQARDELDLLRAYTKSLINSSTGRPHDIVRLQRLVEARDDALIETRVEIEALHLRVSIL